MFKSLLVLFSVSVVICTVYGYSSGAPENPKICETLQPKHPYEPQEKPFPYTVSLDKTQVVPGEVIGIELASPKNDSETKFKGFLVQGRKADFEKELSPVGHFQTTENSEDYRLIKCGEANNTVTHSGPKEKTSMSLKWVAPKDKGTYVILTTVAQNGAIFWVRQPSTSITVV